MPPGSIPIRADSEALRRALLILMDNAAKYTTRGGSVKVGLLIQEQAARTLAGQAFVKRVIAEMGGKNAIIVDADADLDEAVKGVVDSAFGYAGQKCSAGSRAIVVGGIYDQFLARVVEATKSLKIGPAEDPGTQRVVVGCGSASRANG